MNSLEYNTERKKLIIPEYGRHVHQMVDQAVLVKDNEIMHGAKAIQFICSQIKEPSDRLLKILLLVFSSSQRSNYLFPFLLIARRILLFFKGVPRKFNS